MFRRIKQSVSFPDYSLIKKYVFCILILIVIAIIWIFYFTSNEYLGVDNSKISGFIYYKDKPAIGVQVTVGDEEVTTDKEGLFVVSGLSLGKNYININKENFLPIERRVFIWKKNSVLKKINLERDPNYIAYFSGMVLDNFNEKPIEGAIVYLNSSNRTTDRNGWFEFEDVEKGEANFKISAIGFKDREEKIIVGESDGANNQEYRLTPYGRISFTSSREGIKNIYTIGYDGGDLQNLTSRYKADCWGGKFSLDGEKMVFYSTLDNEVNQWGEKIPHLYWTDKNGGNLKRITETVIPEGEFKISDDSQRVVFLAKELNKNISDIYIAGIGTSREWRKLTDNDIFESNIDVSLDGDKVLYSAFVEGARDLYMIDVNTYKETRISENNDYELFASFSLNGREILYVQEGYDFSSKIFVYNTLTEEKKEIYKTSLSLKNVIWSNDGEKVLFASTRDNKTNIFIIDKEGKNEIKLTKENADYRNIIWPDIEKILVFVIYDVGGNKLAVMDLSSRDIIEIEEVGDDVISWSGR